MAHIEITDVNDPRLDAYRNLKTRSENGESLFIAEGAYLVERLARSRHTVLSYLTTDSNMESVREWANDDTPIYCLPPTQIRTLVGFDFHRGIMACGQRPAVADPSMALQQLIESANRSADQETTLLILPKTHDPANLGGILRIAAAFGVAATILGPHCADPLSRRVLRTSMGSSLDALTIETANLLATIGQLREVQFHIAATTLDESATPFTKVTRPTRMALLMGPEGEGLNEELVRACDSNLTIPIRNDVDSLNVTVATGIFLQHFCGS